MRYNRMTEILKTVGSVQLSSAFLLKSHFLKRPLTMLMTLYIFNVFAVGYVIYALERSYGTCMESEFQMQRNFHLWNFHFSAKFRFFRQFYFLSEISIFCVKFRFFERCFDFSGQFQFCVKFRFFELYLEFSAKFPFFDPNFYFARNFHFFSEISILERYFCCSAKFRFLYKISVSNPPYTFENVLKCKMLRREITWPLSLTP